MSTPIVPDNATPAQSHAPNQRAVLLVGGKGPFVGWVEPVCESVDGLLFAHRCATRHEGGQHCAGWTVTHAPSGLMLVSTQTERLARRVLHELEDVDWTVRRVDALFDAQRKQFYAAALSKAIALEALDAARGSGA